MSPDKEEIKKLGRALTTCGVTAFLPTNHLTPRLLENTAAIADACEEPRVGARILGIHMEGPFISPKVLGSVDPAEICAPDLERMKKMKPGAILINVGRGSLIPGEALKKMLVEGHLGDAILDVTEEEPLPADSPLWDLPNLLITPHVSGNYHMRQILDTVVKIAGENLEAFLDGKELVNEVDLCTGYRKFKA